MGGEGEFWKTLERKPIPAYPREGASGSHKGIETPNAPWEIYLACSIGGTFNSATYEQLHTTIDFDGLHDLIEFHQVSDSWQEAAKANAREQGAR